VPRGKALPPRRAAQRTFPHRAPRPPFAALQGCCGAARMWKRLPFRRLERRRQKRHKKQSHIMKNE